ncbi:ATP-binding cassette domain-containing protein [Nakamurella sp. YIM 132087]|uniref:ATP-binding cassette domain-containing protein n=1 Tax=Nakamurella alba TaxID=2665158 RepID=A0A7K1FP91_9ACTN|nr:ABC transporter ATP-binding protein [Nakamurella alba]MTD15968.1 ATP-binding cassette domain-containing protein [Nakamurella alba]
MTTRTLLVEDVGKHFQGVAALTDVSLDVRPGEVLGLVGPNGAGKTTLVNVISGYMPPASGRVRLGEEVLTGLRMESVARRGVARTYQHLRLIDEMSVLDNVLVGRHQLFRVKPWRIGARRRDARAQEQACRELLARLELDAVADLPVESLSYGMRRRVEIARTLAMEPEVLLLDEPTAGMTRTDAHEIGELVRRTSREGIAVLLIEHNVGLVTAVCDRIAVLDWGKVVRIGTPDEVWSDPAVRAAYLGAETSDAAEDPAEVQP